MHYQLIVPNPSFSPIYWPPKIFTTCFFCIPDATQGGVLEYLPGNNRAPCFLTPLIP